MADWSRNSELEDPLQVYNGLWLFPRTLKSLSNSLPPARPDQSDDLQHTHGLLESMPVQIRSEHLEQAKFILDNSSKLLDPDAPANVLSKDENEGLEMNPIANQRERRPGLGRKRARFSLKPITSQPTSSFEPSFDVSKYQNPEDFFSAYEKFENAKREWQKQTGTSLAVANQNQPSIRPRRPGISGRKRVSYNHRYSTDAISLEPSNEEILSHSKHISPKEKTAGPVMNVKRELADTIVDAEKKVDDILGELLACTQDELDGDGAINLLEERLQMKPIDVEKLSLPELQDVRNIGLKASRRNLSKPRSVLSDIQNMLSGIRSKTNSNNTQTASPLQSPLASVSSLKKHTPLSGSQKDQFSFPDSNELLPDVSTSSLIEQFKEVDAANDTNICTRSSTSYNHDNGIGNSIDNGVANRNSIRSELNVDMQAEGNSGGVSISKSDTDRNSSRSEVKTDMHAVQPNQLETLMDDSHRGAIRMDDSTVEKDGISVQLAYESANYPKGTQEQHNEVDGSSKSAGDFQEQYNEQNKGTTAEDGVQEQSAELELNNSSQEHSQTVLHEDTRNKQTKRVSRDSNERKQKKMLSRESKAFSRRKSLRAAGTKWESGIRRSTRIKSRPLEYWKGERFLYGRIHESLATVIGIKYESPAKDKKEKPALKVKSFVSDEYKELVDQAALH